jgi:hypothetical protein
MPKPIHEMSSWNATAHPSRPPEEEWEATRQVGSATQLMRDKDDYLDNAVRDIGRKVGPQQYELFVSCLPAEAMQLQVEHLHPEFIAVHDIGTASSKRLIAGLAAAAGTPTQKLVIRRQGFGMALATLEFVELPTAQGTPLRLYTTEVDADTQQRHALARVLLGHSRLGVVMVGELPPHALAAALQPLRDAMAQGPWPNRNLLLLPLSSAAVLTSQAAGLAGGDINIRTTPQVTRPADAWAFIQGTWARLREQLAGAGASLPEIAAMQAPAAAPRPTGPAITSTTAFAQTTAPMPLQPPPPGPLPMRPMPELPPQRPAAPPASTPGDPLLLSYVQRCLEIKGMVSACVFELAAQRPLAHAGMRPGPASLASQGAALHAAMAEAGRVLGLSTTAIDAAVTLDKHHLLLRALPGRDGVLLHAVLDKAASDLTVARVQLARLDPELSGGLSAPSARS